MQQFRLRTEANALCEMRQTACRFELSFPKNVAFAWTNAGAGGKRSVSASSGWRGKERAPPRVFFFVHSNTLGYLKACNNTPSTLPHDTADLNFSHFKTKTQPCHRHSPRISSPQRRHRHHVDLVLAYSGERLRFGSPKTRKPLVWTTIQAASISALATNSEGRVPSPISPTVNIDGSCRAKTLSNCHIQSLHAKLRGS